MKKLAYIVVVVVLAGSWMAVAQLPPGPPRGRGPQAGRGMGGMRMGGAGMGRRGLAPGKWWTNSELVQQLGLTDAQVRQIESSFQDHRPQLLDLHAALAKQEATLAPLIESDRLDETQVDAQIEKVAQARAKLEVANGRMLLSIRRVLTLAQWRKLQSYGGAVPGAPGFGSPSSSAPTTEPKR